MSLWDQEDTVAEVPKGRRGEVIRVRRVAKDGRSAVDIRTWFPGDDGELRPGKGLTVPIDLAGAVARAILDAAARGEGSA